jgi:hypothetical protein
VAADAAVGRHVEDRLLALQLPVVVSVKRESRLTPCQAEKSEPVAGASPLGVDSGGA